MCPFVPCSPTATGTSFVSIRPVWSVRANAVARVVGNVMLSGAKRSRNIPGNGHLVVVQQALQCQQFQTIVDAAHEPTETGFACVARLVGIFSFLHPQIHKKSQKLQQIYQNYLTNGNGGGVSL